MLKMCGNKEWETRDAMMEREEDNKDGDGDESSLDSKKKKIIDG